MDVANKEAAPNQQQAALPGGSPSALATSGSILPNRASLLPKNSLGALLLDFRASIRAPDDNHYGEHAALDGPPRDSAADLENMLEQLTSGGDADAINQELEKVAPNLYRHLVSSRSSGPPGSAPPPHPLGKKGVTSAAAGAYDAAPEDGGHGHQHSHQELAAFWQGQYAELFSSFLQVSDHLQQSHDLVQRLKQDQEILAKIILSPQEQSSPEAVELLERIKQQQLASTAGQKNGSRGGGGASGSKNKGGEPLGPRPIQNGLPPYFSPPRFPFPMPYGAPYPPYYPPARSGATYPFPPWLPSYGPRPAPPSGSIDEEAGEPSVGPSGVQSDRQTPMKSPVKSKGKTTSKKAPAALPPAWPQLFPPTWGVDGRDMMGYPPPQTWHRDPALRATGAPPPYYPYSTAAHSPPARSPLNHASHSVPATGAKGAKRRPSFPSQLKLSQSEQPAVPCHAAQGGRAAGAASVPYDDQVPLPSPFSQQQDLVLKSMGSFPSFHEGEEDVKGHNAAAAPCAPPADAPPADAVPAPVPSPLPVPGAGVGGKVQEQSAFSPPNSSQQGGGLAKDASTAGGSGGGRATPSGVGAPSLQLGVSSRLSIPMQQLLKLLQQVTSGIMMDSDMEGIEIPSPGGGDPLPPQQGGGGQGGLMSPPPPVRDQQNQHQQGGDEGLNHQLSADGSCMQPSPHYPTAAAGIMDATLSGSTPFSNAYFANAAANGLHISPASTMTKVPQVTQVSRQRAQQYAPPQYSLPSHHQGGVSAYISVPEPHSHIQAGGYGAPSCAADAGQMDYHHSAPSTQQLEQHQRHRRHRQRSDDPPIQQYSQLYGHDFPSSLSAPPPRSLDGAPHAGASGGSSSRKRKSSKRPSSVYVGGGEGTMGPPPPWPSASPYGAAPPHTTGDSTPHSYHPYHPYQPQGGPGVPAQYNPEGGHRTPLSPSAAAGYAGSTGPGLGDPSSSRRHCHLPPPLPSHHRQQQGAQHGSDGSDPSAGGAVVGGGAPSTSGNGSGAEYHRQMGRGGSVSRGQTALSSGGSSGRPPPGHGGSSGATISAPPSHHQPPGQYGEGDPYRHHCHPRYYQQFAAPPEHSGRPSSYPPQPSGADRYQLSAPPPRSGGSVPLSHYPPPQEKKKKHKKHKHRHSEGFDAPPQPQGRYVYTPRSEAQLPSPSVPSHYHPPSFPPSGYPPSSGYPSGYPPSGYQHASR